MTKQLKDLTGKLDILLNLDQIGYTGKRNSNYLNSNVLWKFRAEKKN